MLDDNSLFSDVLDTPSNPSKISKPKKQSSNIINKLKTKIILKPKTQNNTELKTTSKQSSIPQLKEEPIQENDSSKEWTLLTSDNLDKEEDLTETEDIVKTPEREIGKVLKTELDLNDARRLDLSLRDRIRLTFMYANKDLEETKKLEEMRAEEEIRITHIVTLKKYLLTELRTYLTSPDKELVINIDAKFGPYINDVMKEISLSYYVREIPRNLDIVNLDNNLPYQYAFKIKPIQGRDS